MRSVKVVMKCLIAAAFVNVDLPYWTSKVDHIVAFTAIFSNICTVHAQKRLFMNSGVNLDTAVRFPYPDFLLECKISVMVSIDFCILYAKCLPYFYFRLVWLTDLESIPHASSPTSIINIKFEVDMTIHCRVIAFCLLIRHMTLWLWPLTFWPCTVDVHGGSCVQPCHQVWRLTAYPFLSYEL